MPSPSNLLICDISPLEYATIYAFVFDNYKKREGASLEISLFVESKKGY